MSFGSALLVAGCSWKTPIPDPKPDFCQLTEDRKFTQVEFDWRVENAPANLRRDIVQNELRDELCLPPQS